MLIEAAVNQMKSSPNAPEAYTLQAGNRRTQFLARALLDLLRYPECLGNDVKRFEISLPEAPTADLWSHVCRPGLVHQLRRPPHSHPRGNERVSIPS